MNPLKIHFARLRGDREPIDLACALGVPGHNPVRGPAGPEQSKFDELNEEASKWFAAASLEEADVVVYPYRAHENLAEALEVSLLAKERGLPCVFVSWGDDDIAVEVPHGTVYRHSLFADRRLKNEVAMPGFCADPLPDNGRAWTPRCRQEIPSVGFCGFVSSPLKRMIYRLLGRRQKVQGLALRAKVLASLRGSANVRTSFICRDAYWAGAISRFHHDAGAQYNARREFIDNLLGTDYTLCVRGAGNFSYRLYESLAAGRIPLFVNTQCVLPFEDQIDWKHHCVWVEQSQIHQAGQILADFHARLSNEQFEALQAENRKLWEQKLSTLGFYRQALYGAVAAAGDPEPPAENAVALSVGAERSGPQYDNLDI